MKRLLFLLILGISFGASAQPLITKIDSLAAYNDRKITFLPSPNLVHKIIHGGINDSILLALMVPMVDTMHSIAATTNGLQAVLTNSNVATTDIDLISGAGFRLNSGIISLGYLGINTGAANLFLRNGSTANYSQLYSISNGTHTVCLPDDGTGINLQSSLVTHYTKHGVTIDAPGTGDSTVIGQSFIAFYAPPVTTYNMFGQMTPFGLTFGQRNTAHTHQDGLFVGFTADGNNYNQYFQNDTGAIALLHNITASTPTVTATQFAIGGMGNNIVGTADATYDGTNFTFSPSLTDFLELTRNHMKMGDIAGSLTNGIFDFNSNSTGKIKASITQNSGASTFFLIDVNNKIYGIGDGVNGSTAVGKGTNITIADGTKTINKTADYIDIASQTSTGDVKIDYTGINDARARVEPNKDGTYALTNDLVWSNITSTPTTLAGYGITDAVGVKSSVDLTAQTSAATLVTYAVTATGDFQINTYIDITAIATDVVNLRIVWTDQNSNVNTYNAPSATSTGHYDAIKFIRAKTGTNIVISTILTVSSGSITYDAGERILKM